MNKRLNKEELLKLLSELRIDKNEFWLLSTSSLVLRGIMNDAGDLDIAVSDKGLEEIKKNYNIKYKDNGWFIISDKIEGVCDGPKEKLKYQPEEIEGYLHQNIKEYHERLVTSDREKDRLKLPLVEKYIKENYK